MWEKKDQGTKESKPGKEKLEEKKRADPLNRLFEKILNWLVGLDIRQGQRGRKAQNDYLDYLKEENEAVSRYDPLYQIFFEYETLTQSLSISDKNTLPILRSLYPFSEAKLQTLLHYKTHQLREKSALLRKQEDSEFINKMVDIYDALKQCYVISRKEVVYNALEDIGVNLNALMDCLSQKAPEYYMIHHYLYHIYSQIEVLRFNANRDGPLSKNLFQRAKYARKAMREACDKTTYGKAFLENIQIKKASKVKKLLR